MEPAIDKSRGAVLQIGRPAYPKAKSISQSFGHVTALPAYYGIEFGR
ncbi:MAG: hypothetical protein OXI56_04470 [bacterium]|nr:hypothetical protein [bacterium]